MGYILLILLILFLGFVLWVRHLWRTDPLRLFRMMAGIRKPKDSNNSGRRDEENPRQRRYYRRKGKIIPPEYGEDVEYTEFRTYSEETVIAGDSKTAHDEYSESQISDAEWVEVKKK